jgi:choline-glycine betaine transporter
MSENYVKNPLKEAITKIKWSVFAPGIIIFAVAAIIGLIDNTALTNNSQAFFNWSLETFGWLYQLYLWSVFFWRSS